MTPMQLDRPGPLCDLPLDRFVAEANISHGGSLVFPRPRLLSNKRPASPDALLRHSPSKRRLLADKRGIVASPRSNTTSFVHDTSHAEGIKNSDRRANAPMERSQRAKGKEASPGIPCTHNDPAATTAQPRRTSDRLSAASARCTATTTSHVPSLSQPVAVGHLPPVPEPQMPYGCYDPVSIHHPGFFIYNDPFGILSTQQPMQDDDSSRTRSTSSRNAPEIDKENMPPAESFATPISRKGKIASWLPSPFSGKSSVHGSPLKFPDSRFERNTVQMTPLARSFQSASLMQDSPTTPTNTRTLSRTSSLGSPFFGGATPRQTPLDKSERESLRRQLTEEADGDW